MDDRQFGYTSKSCEYVSAVATSVAGDEYAPVPLADG
jgi:hypothetical protein